MMWSFVSNAIVSFRLKKNTIEPSQASLEFSDDETCSNACAEEGLECPICWESFNIVENVPYVLWCGHTLCKNCVLGLQWASLKFSNKKIQIPFFISCPWCCFLTLRLVRKGNLKFPCKNFFLLWMVESLNGDRVKTSSLIGRDHQSVWSARCTSVHGNHFLSSNFRRPHCPGQSESNSANHNNIRNWLNSLRTHLSLRKSLDFFIHITAKFPLVILLLLIVIFAVPASVAILALYLLITILFALPSFLVLYFAYPALDWLVREITK